MGELRRRMSFASGCVVIGFEQITIETGKSRMGIVEDEIIASPWNQVEMGMAAMHHIPTLLICNSRLCDHKPTAGMFGLTLTTEDQIFGPIAYKKTPIFLDKNPHYNNWVSKVNEAKKPFCFFLSLVFFNSKR